MGTETARADTAVDADVVVLARAASALEAELVHRWVGEQRREKTTRRLNVVLLPVGEPNDAAVSEVVDALGSGMDKVVVPVRVFWAPPPQNSRLAKLMGLLLGRDPSRPGQHAQRRRLRQNPSGARVLAGRSATVGELSEQWRATAAAAEPADFARFVVRRAVLAIQRAEYGLLGPEYKSLRLVKPEILSSSRFQQGLAKIPGATMGDAAKMLDEMASGWSRPSIDVIPALYRRILGRGFEPQIDYDIAQVEQLRAALQIHPAVMLFSHRSNLDGMALVVALQDNKLPRAHMFGGINMAFTGGLMRRAGVIFIRRDVGGDPLYKFVLKEYVGYIAAKRFNLMWSIEGTRSRTGKMLPPKLGLMSYVAAAYLEGRCDDILLQPVSISFDQLHETAEYAEYARGGEKRAEGFGWLYRFVKAQGERSFGKIYVRFPAAVSMRQYLGDAAQLGGDGTSADRSSLHRMAIEVAWRIQRATPVSATALVCTALLATHGTALTLGQLHRSLLDQLDYLARKGTPMTGSALALHTPEGLSTALDALAHGHPVTRLDGGWEPVWRIAPEHEHAAAFYRNSIIHAFLETAVVEIALAHTMRAEGDRVQAFWRQAMRIRELLKFDFYFADSAAFRSHIAEELTWQPEWETRLAEGPSAVVEILAAKRPIVSYAMLRTFFEAYEIVADVLRTAPTDVDEKSLTKLAIGVGRQYVAQQKVRSNETVSTLLFATARKVAADQGLFVPGVDLVDRRQTFHRELRSIIDDINHVEAVIGKGRTAAPPPN